tara:strand:+ start:236 stop:376 length:141 start_codon:yes stop_codon:yes gene_type:complete
MKNLNSIKKKISKEDRKVSLTHPSKLLAEFFNGVVIKVDEEYIHES